MREIRHKDFLRLYGGGQTGHVVVHIPKVGEKECSAEEVKVGDVVELPVTDGKNGSDYDFFKVLPNLVATPAAAVEALLSEHSYDVTQRNGVMFSIPSDLSPDEFVRAEMNLGAGPAKIWLRGEPRTLVYDIENPEMVAKFGQPNGPIPVDRPGEYSQRGEYDAVYGDGRHGKDHAALLSTVKTMMGDDGRDPDDERQKKEIAEAERIYDLALEEHEDWWSADSAKDKDPSNLADKILDKIIRDYGVEAGSNLADLIYEHIFAGLT
jgi:hypothetical protein